MESVECGSTIRCYAIFTDVDGDLIAPTSVTAKVFLPGGGTYLVAPADITNFSLGNYFFDYHTTVNGEHRYEFTGTLGTFVSIQSGYFNVIQYAGGIDYLINDLRLHVGDLNGTKYTESTLRLALVAAIKALQRKWNYRYLISSSGVVSRNTTAEFLEATPPTISTADERPIIVQAGIILKSSYLEGSLWDLASWKDDELAYSNLGAGRTAESSITRDLEELNELLKRRLYGSSKQSLPGYKYNIYENGD